MSEQLIEAGILLGVGMSVVFAFLTLLIGGIHSIAWFARVYPAPEVAGHTKNPRYNDKNSRNNATPATLSPTTLAAITAAVNTHRQQNK